jgi:hypothetical protein
VQWSENVVKKLERVSNEARRGEWLGS